MDPNFKKTATYTYKVQSYYIEKIILNKKKIIRIILVHPPKKEKENIYDFSPPIPKFFNSITNDLFLQKSLNFHFFKGFLFQWNYCHFVHFFSKNFQTFLKVFMYQKNCFVELYLQIFQRLLRMFDKILSFFQVIFKLIFGMKNLFMEKNPLDYHFFLAFFLKYPLILH